ncbi:MAG: hypothetical protein ACXWQO_06630 [Bdellovibrionota bacterium]
MQSGRVLPVIRQFFTTSITAKSATDSNSQNHQQKKDQEREPSEEETRAAFELLLKQEEFKTQGLKVELKSIDGRSCIVVSDSAGVQLRVIKGPAILAVLQTSALGQTGQMRGRILDRRL